MKKSTINTTDRFLKFLLLLLLMVSSNFVTGQVSVTATAGTPGPTPYATLQLAFAEINSGTHQGVITVSITGDTTESATAALFASGVGSAVYTAVNISPSGARTISGALAAGSPIIRLNGADNVTIDGLNVGGNSLTISNTSISAGVLSTITLLNDASDNTITRCTILGSATAAGGGNILILGGTTTGNDNNTISFCNIGPAGANLPINGIFVDGTSAAISNDNGAISNNDIFDYFSATVSSNGVALSTDCSGWTISGNRFYQTATRIATGTSTQRAVFVNVTNNVAAFTINNNIIGFANAAGTGRTIYSSTSITNFVGIDLTSAAGIVNELQGNTIAAISYRSGIITNNTASGFFSGFNISGAVNLGTIVPNIVGSATVANSIIIETTVSNAVQERFTGINVVTATAATSTISGNTIAGISTAGASDFGYSMYPILVTGAGNFNITNNTIGSATVPNSISAGSSGTTTGLSIFAGIFSGAAGSTTITGNTIQNATVFGNAAASTLNGITKNSNAGLNAVVISNNIINNLNTLGTSTANGIFVRGTSVTLSIQDNTLTNFELNNNLATFIGIRTLDAISGAIDINRNRFGTATNDFVLTTNVFLSSITGISNSAGSATSVLSINDNDFRRINNNILCSGEIHFIATSGTLRSSTIHNNTFTNIDINTTGNVVIISAAASTAVTGFQTVTNNRIVTAFIRRGLSGNINCFQNASNSAVGSTITHTGNNMSNITVFGATSIHGWRNSDNVLNQKNVNSNTFANWISENGQMTGMGVGGFGNGSTVSNNTINNFSNQGNITGIAITASGNAGVLTVDSNSVTNLNTSGTSAVNNTSNVLGLISSNNSTVVNISNNIINNLSTAGAVNNYAGGIFHSGGSGITNIFNNNVSGLSTSTSLVGSLAYPILVNGGTGTSNVYRNKVYNIFSTATTPTLYGITHSAGLNCNAYNNLITDLRVPNGSNTTTDLIRALAGISGTANSTAIFSYNTVLLSGSGGANFTTTGLFHQNQAATTGRLISRNNIIINNCNPGTGGISSAFRRNSAAFTNYSTLSNNNLYFAGVPSLQNLIYFDGTNRRQTLNAFKVVVAPADSSSETENVMFLSTLPTNPNFLRPDVAVDTFVESSGLNIAGITDDIIETIRFGNPGYITIPLSTGDAPDLGAYEINGTRPSAPVIVSGAIGPNVNDDYPSLSAAFNAINIAPSAQTNATITVRINADIDEGTTPLILNAQNWTSLTINPRRARRVFGNIAGDALITLNGADNVRINGINDAVNTLTIENTSTSNLSGTSTIKFIGDARTNTITNTTIRGAGTTPLATDGGVVFFSTGTTLGNDSNTISNCNIGPSDPNLPSKLIYSSGSIGSAALANSLNVITNCNLFDNFLSTGSAAIYATTGNTNWTITSNRIYQTAPRTFNANGTLHGIFFSSPTFGIGQNISLNTIGYATNTQTGVLTLDGNTFSGSFNGIIVEVNAGGINNINSNIISNISLDSSSGSFNGIATLGASNNINMNSNTIRNITVLTTTGAVAGINLAGGGGSTTNVNGNTINTISRTGAGLFHGIFCNGTLTNFNCGTTLLPNTITGLSSTASDPSTIYGIRRNSASGNGTFTSNIINTLSGDSGTNIYGIAFEASNGIGTMTTNTISNLSSIGGTNAIVAGLTKTNNNNAIFSRNIIFNLSSDASNPNVAGIVVDAANTASITNNRIADLRAPNANAINPINGIKVVSATTVTIVYNSVFLDAGIGITNFGSSALNVENATSIISTNNILVNNSAALGTGVATALRFGSGINIGTVYNTRSRANAYFSTSGTIFTNGGAGGVPDNTTVALFIARVSGTVPIKDEFSIESNPSFISTLGSDPNFLKFDFNVAHAISNVGLPDTESTIDCDNTIRNATNPDIGADEFTGDPSITSYTPINLCETGGQTVTINGTNLNIGGVPTILFNGVLGTILTHTPTLVTVTTPAGLTGATFTLLTPSFPPAITSTPYTVFIAPVVGTLLPLEQIICPNAIPADITITGSSNFTTIAWQRASNAAFTTNVSIIAGQITETLAGSSITALTQDVYIRARLSNLGCAVVNSAAVRIITARSWNGTDWSDGIPPTAGVGAIIAGNLTIASDFAACSMVINSGRIVNVNEGITVTLANQINVNGRINFGNNSSLVQTNSTIPNSGVNFYYNRLTSQLSNNFDFVYWGSPVNAQPLGRIWMAANEPDTFYRWDHPSVSWIGLDLLTVMTPGIGYIARATTNTNGINSDNQVSPLFTVPGTWNANFKGIPNNGNYTVSVGAADNLIANPYPSALDLHAFYNDPANTPHLTGTFLFWTHTTPITNNAYLATDYATYNVLLNGGTGTIASSIGAPTAIPVSYVAAGQSIFAKGLTAGNVTFRNSHRVAGDNDRFYRTRSNNVAQSEEVTVLESSKFWLNLSHTNGLFKQQMITYTESATDAFDVRLDATTSEGNPNIDFYSIIPTHRLTIQSRKLPFEVIDVVNLGYKTVLAGTYKIETDRFDGLFSTQEFYLRDNLTGIVHDIKKNPYTFTTAAGTFNNRFQIIYEYICAQNTMWDGQRWSNGMPSLTKGAVIFEDFTPTSDMSFCTLDIIGSAKVTVSAGIDFNVQHVVNVAETSNLTFDNNANLIQISKTANKGNVTIKRNVELRNLEYTYWGSPVLEQNLLTFSPQTLEDRFFTHSETMNNFTAVANVATQNFQPGNGYSIVAPNNFGSTPTTFNALFKGTPSNGDFEIAGTKNNLGFNLVGNPYPSILEGDSFLSENPSTLYFWSKSPATPTANNYATYTRLGGAAATASGDKPNGKIQVGQGFYCQIPAGKPIKFNNNMRSGATSTQFFRVATPANATLNTPISAERHRLWLNLTGSNTPFNQIAVGYMAGATNLFDAGIDGQLYSKSATALYSISDSRLLAIQGRQLPFVSTDRISLGFKTDLSSNFTITIDQRDGLFTNQIVYLQDNLLNIDHNLSAAPYSFISVSGTFDNRFELKYTTGTLSIDNPILDTNTVIVAKADNSIKIKSSNQSINKVLIFDLLGRKVFEQNKINANDFTTKNMILSQQTLIVKIVLEDGIVVTRKLIF